ncbi:MAG TPA: hypothetical protein PKN15_12210 [Chitinophagales bacterium]|nr:hypothetical protein [Chitinophagales bacterium]
MRQKKKDRSAQLLEYSALSLAFIGLPAIADAQVVYVDVDPDTTTYLDEYELDMDNDGSVDFKLIFDTDIFATFAPPELKLRINPLGSNSVAFLYQSIPVTYSGMPFSTYIDGATAIFFTDVALLNDGDVIDNALNFQLEKAALYSRRFFFIYSESNYAAFGGGYWNETTDHFAGFRLFTDGAYHYGWIRLNVSADSGITLLDYAYELNPETPLTAQVRDYKISWVSVGDAGITETTADLAFSFNAAVDQADIASYRIFCVPTADVNDMTPDIAASLSPDRYVEIIPDGSDVYSGTFSGILLDSNGDPIVEGVNYKLMAVNIMANNYLPLLSVPSAKFSLVNTVQMPLNVTLSDLNNTGTGEDVRVKFDAPSITQGISSYRIIILPRDSADAFTLDEALLVTPENFTEVAVGDADYAVMLNSTSTDAYGNLIYLEKYKAVVLSMADDVTVAHDAMSDVSGVVVLETATAVASGVTLSDVNETASGFDLHVSFNYGTPEQTVATYQLYFVDYATAFDFDVAAALASPNFISFTPDNVDFTFTGNDTLRDSDGDLISWGVPYYAWVLSVSSDFGVSDTLSEPSNQVILNFPVGIETSDAATDQLSYSNGQFRVSCSEEQTLSFYNLSGELISSQVIFPGITNLPVDLPAAMYLARLSNGKSLSVLPFVVTGTH